MYEYFTRHAFSALMSITAAAGAIAAACTMVQAQGRITGTTNIGNEIVPQLESVARTLQERKCLTDAERQGLISYLNALSTQLDNDWDELYGFPTTGVGVPPGLRNAKTRVTNLQRSIDRDKEEVKHFTSCPPGPRTNQIYVGGHLLKNWAKVRSTETDATNGVVTNTFSDSGDPLGIGVSAGYNFRPWNNIALGPFVSVDWLHQTVNHTFPSSFYLGTTTHWIITAGARAGYAITPNTELYGLAGAAWLNQNLVLNFPLGLSSTTATTPGFTLGFGGEYYPAAWQISGNPISVFVQYQYTWWDTANFNAPTSSPGFNYAFKRQDNTIKFGANIYLSR